jgi:hypothetical protein
MTTTSIAIFSAGLVVGWVTLAVFIACALLPHMAADELPLQPHGDEWRAF